MDDARLDGQIGVDEIRRAGVVGVDAADFGRGQEDAIWALALEKSTH